MCMEDSLIRRRDRDLRAHRPLRGAEVEETAEIAVDMKVADEDDKVLKSLREFQLSLTINAERNLHEKMEYIINQFHHALRGRIIFVRVLHGRAMVK